MNQEFAEPQHTNDDDDEFRQRLDVLYQENWKSLQRHAKTRTKNHADAEDAVHNVFLKLLQRGEFPPDFERNPVGYLHQAAWNAAISIVRSQDSRRVIDEPLDSLELLAPEDELKTNPAHIARIGRLRRAMAAELDAETAEMLFLHYWDGYSIREIATMKGLAKSTVGSILDMAKDRLGNHILGREKQAGWGITERREEVRVF
jgi:RNA polymerase sigma factor (sigma-70 family)